MSDNQKENIKEWVHHSEIVDLGPEIEGVRVWGEKTNQKFRKVLLDWYDKEGRSSLPWRKNKDPYRIWISEIMLQQTQVETVIPYYNRFMTLFPNVETLAKADEDELLKAWEGLGYYSRARNLKVAANQLLDDYNGVFPKEVKALKKLKGIGPYTAGAIASMAFNEPVVAVDGNAMRVFGRIFSITADISKPKTVRLYEKVIQYVLDPDRPGAFNQALMDLGSSYETSKAPLPLLSPIKDFSLAHLTDTVLDYPVKIKRTKQKVFHYDALILENAQKELFIQRRPSKGLLANLWTVPLFLNEDPQEKEDKEKSLLKETEESYHTKPIIMKKKLGQVKHVFSHQIWEIDIYYGLEVEGKTISNQETAWMKWHQRKEFAFPTLQNKIWKIYEDYLKEQNKKG